MAPVKDDLSPTAKALSPIQGLVTQFSVWLQTTPVLTIVQHKDQLDVVNCPYEG